MENQHQKIKTYRDLTEMEVELMNEVKVLEAKILDKIEAIGAMRQAQKDFLRNQCDTVEGLNLKQLNESHRCLALAKTNIQQGFMWGVRAIALPSQLEVTDND